MVLALLAAAALCVAIVHHYSDNQNDTKFFLASISFLNVRDRSSACALMRARRIRQRGHFGNRTNRNG